MRQQRVILQMKEQDKTPEEELSEMDRQSTWERVQGSDCKDDQRI